MARIFAALQLPVDVTGHLDEHLDGLRASRPDLRWSPPAKWHLTLEFIGECGPYEVDRQRERWERRARRGQPMDLHLAGAGTFPKTFIARVLWAGLAGDVAAFTRVAATDQQPHVTLARTRERTDLTGPVLALGPYVGPTWTAAEVVLIESRRGGSRGSEYEVLERFPLGVELDQQGPLT